MFRKIMTIDCQYLHPKFAASYLVVDVSQPTHPRAAFIDNNTALSVPLLLQGLRDAGLTAQNIDYIIITHVHLDHAGGTSVLAEACPQAKVVAHPRAAKHIIDPEKLIKSATAVYGGEENFKKLYGFINPIAANRVLVPEDGEQLPWGGSYLKFIYTRGHANHHFCIYEPETRSIFTGDSFGLCYPALGDFIFPSTSPTDFDPLEAKQSLQKILSTSAQRAYLTHYGAIDHLPQAAQRLDAHLSYSAQLLNEATASSFSGLELQGDIRKKLQQYFLTASQAQGLKWTQKQWDLLKLDLDLNAAGIAHVAEKIRSKN